MLRNYFLVNVLLILVVVLLGMKFYEAYQSKLPLPAGPAERKAAADGTDVKEAEKPLDISVFQVISLMDLFRPTRTPFVKEEETQKAPPPVPPRLFGTVILGSEKSAILEDPNSKSTRLYKLNETVGGYVISDIFEDKVVLSWNGDKSDVKLREEKKGIPQPRPMMQPQMQPPVPPQPGQPPQIQPGIQPGIQPQPRPVPQRPPVVPARPVPGRQIRPNPNLPTRR